MTNILLTIHIITIFTLIVLILLQRGKGASMGASFGAGASETVFGAVGSTSVFAKITTFLTAVFFATSLGLAVISKTATDISSEYDIGSELTSQETILPSEATAEEPIKEDSSNALKDDDIELPE